MTQFPNITPRPGPTLAPLEPTPVPTPGPICERPGPDTEDPNLRPWTPNRWDTTFGSLFGRQEPPLSPDGALQWWEPGATEIITAMPTGLNGEIGDFNNEVAVYATGFLHLDADGAGVAVFGNQPDITREIQTVFGYPVVMEENDFGLIAGDVYFALGYENRPAVEVDLSSTFGYCGVIE